jgi:uncharacterized OB-fold protein
VSHPTSADPRPRTDVTSDGRWLVSGRRCLSCDEATAFTWPRCPACGGETEPASFGPTGTVWSSTVVRIPVPGRTPPYAIAYVDIDHGPRVLAHVTVTGRPTDAVVPIGRHVRLAAPSADGDLQVEVIG